jgi:diadenylate cyclase|tara:strand:+ start:2985 stop:3827 length:843 start_codon:yes stop_codon:yes gene_type:complete
MVSIWQGVVGYWRPVAEISILSVAIYFTLKFFRGTRGWPMVLAFLGLLVVLLVCIKLELTVLSSLLNYFFGLSAFAALIIFQPELRRLLAGLGNLTFFGALREQRENIEVVIQAIDQLSEARTGALIAIEQSTHLQDIVESGITVDCEATPEMIETIFFPNNAIHDGGIIINEDRILSAACIFPLTRRQDISKTIGTRHRAAIGMSEESDSLVIAVSEETGAISTAFKGQLVQGISLKKLRGTLNTVFVTPIRNRSFKGWIKSLKPKLSGAGLLTKTTGN